MYRILSLVSVLLLIVAPLSCACANAQEVDSHYGFLADALAASYREPVILSSDGFGPLDGRPDDNVGVCALCIVDHQNTYWLSIFGKEPSDESYVLSGELKDIRFRGALPTNLFVELHEARSSKEYLLTYGYNMDGTYIQVECYSLVGSKEWNIKSFSVYDEKTEKYGFIDFAPSADGIAVYIDIPSGEDYKHNTPAYFCRDSNALFSTAFSDLDIEHLFSLLSSPSL